MKKTLTALIFIAGINFSNAIDLSNCELKTFSATAYYSPVENQQYYVRGNLEDEYKLQGKGIKGASGKPVFEGMIAAPKNYEFGTQLYFSGYGMAEISDRGGAIVSVPGGNDRIDIWMGRGEEGLRRALTFGRKTLDAYLCPAGTTDIDFDIDKFPSVKQLIDIIPSNQVKQKIAGLFETYLDIKNQSEKNLVQQLEEILANKGLLDKKLVDGKYDYYTSQSICMYQLINKILVSEKDLACGNFGPQTSQFLKQDQNTYNLGKFSKLRLQVKREFLKRARQNPLSLTTQMGNNIEKIDNNIASIKNSSSSSTKSISTNERLFSTYMDENSFDKQLTSQLQTYLKKLGFFEPEITGNYGPLTKQAVCDFQLKNKILGEKTDPLCGVWGPSTRKTLYNQISNL